jgi:hypothetical protein
MTLPTNLQNIVADIAGSGRSEISLDELAEMVVGDAAIGQAELQLLIEHLELQGINVVDAAETSPAQKVLAIVFTAAHSLREKLGRAPSIDEIAAATALDRAVVQGAVAHARKVSQAGIPKSTTP